MSRGYLINLPPRTEEGKKGFDVESGLLKMEAIRLKMNHAGCFLPIAPIASSPKMYVAPLSKEHELFVSDLTRTLEGSSRFRPIKE